MAEYTKEQFRQQVQVGIEYIRREGIDPKDEVSYLTDHLWGTIGMLLHVLKEPDNRVYYYDDPAMYAEVDPDGPNERYGLHL